MPKILVIDDDLAIVDLLRVMLTEGGHQVLAANGADEAAALAASEKPDLITLDFHMPGDDGVETYRRLRALESAARTPIVFITGGDPGGLLAKMPTDSGVSFIEKPIDMDLLSRMIAELLGYSFPEKRPPV